MKGKQDNHYHSPGRLRQLFRQYLDGQCGAAELDELLQHFDLPAHTAELGKLVEEALRNKAFSTEEESVIDDTIRRNEASILTIPDIRRIGMQGRWWRPVAVAAAIFIVVAGSWLLLENRWTPSPTVELVDIEPGGNRATLTLADGRTVELSEAYSGIIFNEDGIKYRDGSEVWSKDERNKKQGLADIPGLSSTDYYVLNTPKGGTYRITLPDGSNVWLNAASTLTYPSRFDDAERIVELEGEAFFEIKEQRIKEQGQHAHTRLPFLVRTASQTVEVLGTSFNISAYPDDPETKTTLVEGSVSVSQLTAQPSHLLKPSQQATLSNGRLSIQEVDVSPFVGWKEGLFVLSDVPLRSAVRQLERWYDVEFVGGLPEAVRVSAILPRDVNLSDVLNVLGENAGLNFKVTGRRIMVQP